MKCVYLNNPALTRTEFIEILAGAVRADALTPPIEGRASGRARGSAARATRAGRDHRAGHRRGAEPELRASSKRSGCSPTSRHDREAAAAGAGRSAGIGPAARGSEPASVEAARRTSMRDQAVRGLGDGGVHHERAFEQRAVSRRGCSRGRRSSLIHEHSRGIPRTISVMCDNALVSGFALGRQPVDREILLEVARDFDLAAAPAGRWRRSRVEFGRKRGPKSVQDRLESATADDTTGEGPQMNAFRRGMALFGGKRR